MVTQFQAAAQVAGKTVDELAGEALRKAIDDRKWQDLLDYGRKNGAASGYSEDNVPEIVRNRRRINSQRS